MTDKYNGMISAGHARIQGTTRALLQSIDYCDELIDRYVADEGDLAIQREHNCAFIILYYLFINLQMHKHQPLHVSLVCQFVSFAVCMAIHVVAFNMAI